MGRTQHNDNVDHDLPEKRDRMARRQDLQHQTPRYLVARGEIVTPLERTRASNTKLCSVDNKFAQATISGSERLGHKKRSHCSH